MALIFGTLPEMTMAEWLGSRTIEPGNGISGLNVALPLDNADAESSRKAFSLLQHSDDEMARSYYWDSRNGRLRPKPVVAVIPATTATPGHLMLKIFAAFFAGLSIGTIFGRLWRSWIKAFK